MLTNKYVRPTRFSKIRAADGKIFRSPHYRWPRNSFWPNPSPPGDASQQNFKILKEHQEGRFPPGAVARAWFWLPSLLDPHVTEDLQPLQAGQTLPAGVLLFMLPNSGSVCKLTSSARYCLRQQTSHKHPLGHLPHGWACGDLPRISNRAILRNRLAKKSEEKPSIIPKLLKKRHMPVVCRARGAPGNRTWAGSSPPPIF